MIEYEKECGEELITDCLILISFTIAAGNAVCDLNEKCGKMLSNNELSEEEKTAKEISETEQVIKHIQYSFKTLDIRVITSDLELSEHLMYIGDIISNIHCSGRLKLTADVIHIKKCANEIDTIMDRRYGTSWECNKLCNLHYL